MRESRANDLGGAVDGSGGSSEAADKVVEEIKAPAAKPQTVLQSPMMPALPIWSTNHGRYGRIDVLVNTAALRDSASKNGNCGF